MFFTSTPQSGESIYGPLLYEFGDEADPRDLSIEVLDVPTRTTLFKKVLYNTSSGSIDIAPLLQRHLKWEPQSTPEGFSSAASRVAYVTVCVEGVSVTRRFYPSLEPLNEGVLCLSSMPTERLLARGEREELFLPMGILRAEVERYTPTGSTIEEFYNDFVSEPALFGLRSEEWEEEVSEAVVRLYTDKASLQLHYTLCEPPSGGTRVAWVGRCGGVEHYTFPICEHLSELQHQSRIELTNGESLLQKSGYESCRRLRSAYEGSAMLQALAELGTAPEAWIVDSSGAYHTVAITPEERTLHRHGALSSLTFTLKSNPKEFGLWS